MWNLSLSVALCATPTAQSLGEALEWATIEQAVVCRLRTADRAEVIAQIDAARETRGELLGAFALSERLGLDARARGFLERLDGDGSEPWAAPLVDSLIERERWSMCAFALQRMPAVAPQRASHWVRHRATETTVETIDADLVRRGRACTGDGRHQWFRARLELWRRADRTAEFARRLELRAKLEPEDTEGAVQWLEAARYALPDPAELDWVEGHFRPRLAFDASVLGSALRPVAPAAARAMLERALEMPFTDEDRARCHYSLTLGMTHEQVFRDGLRFELDRLGRVCRER